MSRSDVHRDGLARELGATRHQSAPGKAAAADLAKSRRRSAGCPGMPVASPGSTTADGSNGSGTS